jgi:Arylsulfotransferase (ASST)
LSLETAQSTAFANSPSWQRPIARLAVPHCGTRATTCGYFLVVALALIGSLDCGQSSGAAPDAYGVTSGTGGVAAGDGGAGRDASGAGGAASVDGGGGAIGCAFTVTTNEISSQIPTVGVVEWSLTGAPPSSAKIVYALSDADPSLLNQGGEAPVELANANYRTLLLGLKQSKDYTFHIEASRGGATCLSADYALPTTGSLANAPSVTLNVAQPGAREPGFIVTSSGTSVPDSAYIIDADGEMVWFFPGPLNTCRAQMDYEGNTMWMITCNPINEMGELRSVSMDGVEVSMNVPGFDGAHHDLTVMPGGRVAALVWTTPDNEPPSDLVIRTPDGQTTTAFTIGSNLYLSDLFHANAVHYLPSDDSFTVADRDANVVVKVSSAGVPQWQLGGVCDGAPTGTHCSPQSWLVNHGHHLLDDGTLVLFNNTETAYDAHVLEFQVDDTASGLAATMVRDYAGTAVSATLGDVQRLPGGNTLVTYSEAGQIVELDASWNVVQTFTVRVGYSNWRPTLYGPPLRL